MSSREILRRSDIYKSTMSRAEVADVVLQAMRVPAGEWSGETFYVAGGMRGYYNSNFANFDKARDYLLSKKHRVISPADLDRVQGIVSDGTATGELFRTCMFLDIEVLLRYVDGIYFLDRWWKSEGAVTEYVVGRALGLKMLFQNEEGPKNLMIFAKDFSRCL